MRKTLLTLGLLSALLGAAGLNYTAEGNAEELRSWAARHDLPGPELTIFHVALGLTLGGAAMFGFAFGRPRRKS